MILLLEDRHPDFAKAFWEYVRAGNYRCGWKNDGQMHFYRFTEPDPGYPAQIELFSRMQDYHLDTADGEVIPVHIDDEVSSLSAILMNDDFYHFMINGRKVIDGLCVLRAEYLIPFKMYAWQDLSKKKETGAHVNERDLRKHKYDVFRLLQIIPSSVTPIETFGLVREQIESFMQIIQNEELNLSQIGIMASREESLALLRQLYPI